MFAVIKTGGKQYKVAKDDVIVIERIAGEENRNPEILLEVNISGEASKGGMNVADLPAAAEKAAACRNVRFSGLMTMAPFEAPEAELKEIFSSLKSLRDTLSEKLDIQLPVLSMGMSGDFPVAVLCGSTLVRVGSKIFEGIERIPR